MKLSICMMVKNEEKNLDRCLRSLKPLMAKIDSELIIVDTGSEDSTVEIAKKYTDKVYFHAWNNNFSDMRNITISYAKGEWLLIVDADEELEEATRLIGFLNSDVRNDFAAGVFTVRSIVQEGKESGLHYANIVRLFKRVDEFKFTGSIHETPYIGGKVIDLETTFKHYGYSQDDREFAEKKHNRNTPLLLEEVKKDPKNIMYRNYLCTQYLVHKEFNEALEQALAAYNLIKETGTDPKKFLFLYPKLSTCYVETGKLDYAERICKEGLSLSNEHIDLHYTLATIYAINKKYENAIEHYNQYLKLIANFSNLSIKRNGMSEFCTLNRESGAYLDLATIYLEQRNYEISLEYISKVSNKEDIDKIFSIYLRIYIDNKEYKNLRKYYETNVLNDNASTKSLFIDKIEIYKETLSVDEKLKLYTEFSKVSDAYGELNAIRLSYYNKDKSLYDTINDYVESNNIDNLSYSDLIYFLLAVNKPISCIFAKINEIKVVKLLDQINKNYRDFTELSLSYLKAHDHCTNFIDIRANKTLSLYLLLSNKLSSSEYRSVFDGYIKDGLIYVEAIYSSEVLESSLVYDVKNDFEAFLLCMRNANLHKNDGASYIKDLRTALNLCPVLKRGVDILLEEFETSQSIETTANINSEFEEYKIKLKSIIKDLIKANDLAQAKLIIEEYKKIVPDDDIDLLLETSV